MTIENPPEPPNGVEYDASAIQVLEGLEAVRKRPGMYIGSTGERGLHHLIWEIVDNAVDEALAGYCDRIVRDPHRRRRGPGRGQRPRHPHRHRARARSCPRSRIALTLLHAGGKFGGGGYKVSGGLHGVGVSVVNALSTRLVVEVRNRGHLWRQSFNHRRPRRRPSSRSARWSRRRGHRHHGHLLGLRGHLRDHDLLPRDDHRPGSASTPSSTRAWRSSSATSGRRPTTMVDAVEDDTIEQRHRPGRRRHDPQAARAAGSEQVFKYDRGLVDYVEHLNRSKQPANPTVISFEAETPGRARTTT